MRKHNGLEQLYANLVCRTFLRASLLEYSFSSTLPLRVSGSVHLKQNLGSGILIRIPRWFCCRLFVDHLLRYSTTFERNEEENSFLFLKLLLNYYPNFPLISLPYLTHPLLPQSIPPIVHDHESSIHFPWFAPSPSFPC